MSKLTPAHEALIDALAEAFARDYLREQSSNDAGREDGQTERVLPRLDKAA